MWRRWTAVISPSSGPFTLMRWSCCPEARHRERPISGEFPGPRKSTIDRLASRYGLPVRFGVHG
jgi:hypothetical protein